MTITFRQRCTQSARSFYPQPPASSLQPSQAGAFAAAGCILRARLPSLCGFHVLTADKVLVTIGTPCSVSAVGTTETYQARVTGAPEFIAFAAFDAGLIDIDAASDGSLQLRWTNGEPATLAEIEQRHGQRCASNLGIRYFDELTSASGGVVTDIAAALPHDFESGGLRRLAGLTYRDVRDSALKDMYGLFDDDPRIGPSLQAQLFAYSGLGALAALPAPLSELLPNPYDFRVAAARRFRAWIRWPSCARPARWKLKTTSCATSSRCGLRARSPRTVRRCFPRCWRRRTRSASRSRIPRCSIRCAQRAATCACRSRRSTRRAPAHRARSCSANSRRRWCSTIRGFSSRPWRCGRRPTPRRVRAGRSSMRSGPAR